MVRVKDQLHALGVRPSKERGQNFLLSPEVPALIAGFGAVSPGESVVEIGPGLGALTEELLKKGPVTAIEIEGRFVDSLQSKFENLTLIHSDIREVDLARFGEKIVVFGNVPYRFSTDIVFHLIDHACSIDRAILMVQKEFGERLAAPPGGRDYGVLSVNCQMWCDVTCGPIVTGASFHPPANVDSVLVRLTFLREPRVKVRDPEWFKRVVKASFLQRRKKIMNSLLASGYFNRAQLDGVFQSTGLDSGRRAETFSIAEFGLLADALLALRGS